MDVTETIKQCHEILNLHYGKQMKGLILYGSTAREQAHPKSDIDLLVLLDNPFNYFQELRQIIELLYPVQLETERLLSAKPVLFSQYQSGNIQLYRNALREGIPV